MRGREPFPDEIEHMARMRNKSAHYSPPRDGPRRAWGPEDEMIGNQMSFGRDKYEREKMAAEAHYRGRSGSPLRRSPRARSIGKEVRFA